MAFLPQAALELFGFAKLGKGVLLSDRASIYGADRISIGDNARIDDFCILSAGEGGFDIGRHVHVACYVSIIGAGRVTLEDFSGVSSRTAIYSSNDDYSGDWMTGPTLHPANTNVYSAPVRIGRHAVIGASCVILPGIEVGEGAVVGALSLVNRDCSPWGVYVGQPAKKIKDRSKKLLEVEKQFWADQQGEGPTPTD